MWKSILGAAVAALAGCGAWAADPYPSRPIRIIDGFAPGGSTDFIARTLGPKLTERFGQTVIVDNRPGAGSNLGAEIAAHANPDGHTLMLCAAMVVAASRTLYPRLGYDLLKDFAYVARVATGTNVLVAHPSFPAKSVQELVALARARPKTVRYGSGGVSSTSHLTMELLQSVTGMELQHLPYKGGALATAAVLGGEAQIAFASVTSSLGMLKAQRLNAIAVSSAKRLPAFPDVPTVAESGYPGFEVQDTYGVLAPAATPAAIVRLLCDELRKIVQMEDIKARLVVSGIEAAWSTPEEFRAIMETDVARLARVIKSARITVQ